MLRLKTDFSGFELDLKDTSDYSVTYHCDSQTSTLQLNISCVGAALKIRDNDNIPKVLNCSKSSVFNVIHQSNSISEPSTGKPSRCQPPKMPPAPVSSFGRSMPRPFHQKHSW